MMRKIFKPKNDRYTIKYYAIDSKEPDALYLTFKSWSKPKQIGDLEDHAKNIRRLNKLIKQDLYFNIPNIFDKNITITDLDMSAKGFHRKKSVFMYLGVVVFQRDTLYTLGNPLLNENMHIIINQITSILNKNDYFHFSKLKK